MSRVSWRLCNRSCCGVRVAPKFSATPPLLVSALPCTSVQRIERDENKDDSVAVDGGKPHGQAVAPCLEISVPGHRLGRLGVGRGVPKEEHDGMRELA